VLEISLVTFRVKLHFAYGICTDPEMDPGCVHIMDAATVFQPIWSPNLLLFKIVDFIADR
jgi:hypothetical protein